MEILVCVKRVPMVGGKIVVTADGQDVDTRMSGFTVSPHEECAVEEAVQLTERLGGTVTVLTLGPPEAADQLRDMLALGAGRACCWRPTAGNGARSPPRRRSPPRPAAGPTAGRGPTTCCCSGNEAADTGDYQVPVRVAHALGWPCVTGIKNLEITERGGRARPREYRGQPGGVRPGAARGGQRQGGHQPAQVPVAARQAAREAGRDRANPAAVASRRPAQAAAPGARDGARSGPRCSVPGRTRCPPCHAARRAGGAAVTVLCLVELDGDGVADASLRALTFARAWPAPLRPGLAAVVFGEAGALTRGARPGERAGRRRHPR